MPYVCNFIWVWHYNIPKLHPGQQVRKSELAEYAFRVLLVGRSCVHVQHLMHKFVNRFQHEWQSIRSVATEIIVVGNLAVKGVCNKTEIYTMNLKGFS
jgi:phosphoheptose isomerase